MVQSFSGFMKARTVFANPQMCRLLGYSQEEMVLEPMTLTIRTPEKTWLLHRLLLGIG
jgi:PAS domain-containing protein